MKSDKLNKNNKATTTIIATIAALTLTAFALVSTSLVYAYAQIQLPPIQLPPGAIAIPPNQQHGPSQAQIQSDLAKDQGQGVQYIQSITNLINQRLANNPSVEHATQVLKQLTAEGKINCPAPFANPGHCFLTPKAAAGQIAPPIG